MSFLIDTDICSAHLRGAPSVTSRFLQHSGRLYVSTVCIAELNTWLYRKNTPIRFREGFSAMMRDFTVLPVDETVAELFGKLGAQLADLGISVSTPDLLIASTAMTHDLTLVTHNTRHFERIPGLLKVDWLA
jgi:tRNA(fMet)-specific endonuclease VapC